jgi:hypothetical protein
MVTSYMVRKVVFLTDDTPWGSTGTGRPWGPPWRARKFATARETLLYSSPPWVPTSWSRNSFDTWHVRTKQVPAGLCSSWSWPSAPSQVHPSQVQRGALPVRSVCHHRPSPRGFSVIGGCSLIRRNTKFRQALWPICPTWLLASVTPLAPKLTGGWT